MFYYSWFSFNKKYLVLKRKYLRQGCGYPPSVNCTTWISRFGAVGSTFPCHYARTNQSLAITHLDTQVSCDWWRAGHVTTTRRRTCGTCWCPPASPSPPASSPGSPSVWCTPRKLSYFYRHTFFIDCSVYFSLQRCLVPRLTATGTAATLHQPGPATLAAEHRLMRTLLRVEVETNLREVFTITEKVPSSG